LGSGSELAAKLPVTPVVANRLARELGAVLDRKPAPSATLN
jgi:hypothetical protein